MSVVKKDFISVIIPSFNREAFLEKTILSVLNQKNPPPFEIIVVDDGSTDHTKSLVQSLNTKNNIRYFYQTRSGVSAARNKGVEQAYGDIICFLDSDDLWMENKLELQWNYLKSNPKISFVHSEEIWLRDGKRIYPKKKHKKQGGFIFDKCLKMCVISPSAVMMKKDLFLQQGGFDESYLVCEDYDLWLKISLENEIGFIETPLVTKQGGHLNQLSHQFSSMDEYRIHSLINMFAKVKDEKYKKELTKELNCKIDILLKGYIKHKKYNKFKKLESLKLFL